MLTVMGVLTCAVPAQLQWTQKDFICARGRTAMAYHETRGRIVLFGGVSESRYLGDTWEWDGVAWAPRLVANAPSPRLGHTMVYDSRRQRVVLFGGQSDAGWHNDTWEWDGTAWSYMPSPVSPPPQGQHKMAYDSTIGRTLMYGMGSTGGELWSWDGATWAQIAGPAASIAYMTYDESRSRLVVLAQRLCPCPYETWEWDGTGWLQVTATTPPIVDSASMAYHQGSGRVLLFGGCVPTSGILSRDLWAWDGASWTLVSQGGPSGRVSHAMASLGLRDSVVSFGGVDPYIQSDTWEWDGATWTDRSTQIAPPGTWGHAMVYDATRQEVMLLGGPYGNRTGPWFWNGTTWRRGPVWPWGPPSDLGPAMAHHTASGRTVVFGGDKGGYVHDETWQWDGTSWALSFPNPRPAPRLYASMAYDPIRRRSVLFGGGINGIPSYNDTWEWDGSVWKKMNPPSCPSIRWNSGMTWDPVTQRVLLFSGTTTADTWTWDGSTWTQLAPSQSPSARGGMGICTDTARNRVLVFGGGTVNGFANDLWEWDGATWTQLMVAPGPVPRASLAMVYEPQRSRVLLCGGGDILSKAYPDTWVLSWLPGSIAAPYGTGCGGSSGVPVLEAFGRPALANSGFALDVRALPATAPLAYVLAAAPASLPLGSCQVLISPSSLVALPATASAFGLASIRLPIADDLGLAGANAYAQAVALDPTAPLSLSLTNGIRLMPGE